MTPSTETVNVAGPTRVPARRVTEVCRLNIIYEHTRRAPAVEAAEGGGGDQDDGDGGGTELTVISDSSLPAGMVGQPYAEALLAVGGTPPYTWSVVAGALPPGLTLDPTTGSLDGNPTVPGTFRFSGLVTDTKDDAAAREFLTRIELDPNLEPRLGAQPNGLTFSFAQVSPAATKKLSVLN